ncbi:MAG: hypothetical protein C0525_02200 [Flavobacterium sp.]|uniref:hypothetical protein n=1 Tax=Flavobacterium sp. TaxID=239 RepID=UPI0025C056FE|nr:hypothetical protein [Flavobacterium sp.]MBA4133515.1 hypothetical protein [Flavobacterium sp.]
MKRLIFAILLLFNVAAFAQKPCEIDQNIADSLGTFKSTKAYIVFERSFAGNSTDIFFSLTSNNGVLGLEAQFLQRSKEFIKATCFDSNSKIYLQLSNGKIVTLLHAGADTCGTLVVGEGNINNRVMTGSFVFARENYEDLRTSPVTFMRVRFAGETVDYPFRTELVAEMDKVKYEPENYFIQNLKCIEN